MTVGDLPRGQQRDGFAAEPPSSPASQGGARKKTLKALVHQCFSLAGVVCGSAILVLKSISSFASSPADERATEYSSWGPRGPGRI